MPWLEGGDKEELTPISIVTLKSEAENNGGFACIRNGGPFVIAHLLFVISSCFSDISILEEIEMMML